MRSKDSPRQEISYGPFPRPWLDLWVIPFTFVLGVAFTLIAGLLPDTLITEPRLSCERSESGGSCTLTHIYVGVPIEVRTFPIGEVRGVHYDQGRVDGYTEIQLANGEKLIVDQGMLYPHEQAQAIRQFFDDPSVASLAPQPWPGLFTSITLGILLAISLSVTRDILRRPTSIEILLDGVVIIIRQRWFGVPLQTRTRKLNGVRRVVLKVYDNAKTSFHPRFIRRPAARMWMVEVDGTRVPVSRYALFGDIGEHERVAEALAAANGATIDKTITDDAVDLDRGREPSHAERTRLEKRDAQEAEARARQAHIPEDPVRDRLRYRRRSFMVTLAVAAIAAPLVRWLATEQGPPAAIATGVVAACLVMALLIGQTDEIRPHGWALILSGRERRLPDGTTVRYRVADGHHARRIPWLESVEFLDLRAQWFRLQTGAQTKDALRLDIELEIAVELHDDEPLIHQAIARFLDDSAEVERVARETLDEHVGRAIGEHTAEEIREDPDAFAEALFDQAERDMDSVGIALRRVHAMRQS